MGEMRSPEEIAQEIVNKFSWSSNRMLNGRLVGEQYFVAQAIADAIKADRAAHRMHGIEIRRPAGVIDEIVAENCNVHIEQLSNVSWYIGITAANGDFAQFDLGAKRGRAHVSMIQTDNVSSEAPPTHSSGA